MREPDRTYHVLPTAQGLRLDKAVKLRLISAGRVSAVCHAFEVSEVTNGIRKIP